MLNSETYYIDDLKEISSLDYKWSIFFNKTVMISGATGMIGKFLIDLLMYKNRNDNLNCKVVALGRSIEKAKNRFPDYINNEYFIFKEQDITKEINYSCNVDYVIHGASNTHPVAYATDPIGTITSNVEGCKRLLDFSVQKKVKRFILLSSVEIYGENRGDVNKFDESYCGYIDSNTLRAGYPESKRVSEALCQAYRKQYNMDIVIPRLARVYGPTMLMSDTKALSQFIKNALENKNIVLKSEGLQYYSYVYVADCVSAIIKLLINGKNGDVYNVCDEKSDIHLKDLAQLIANYNNRKVIFELPDETEKKGYSKATKALLDNGKLKQLGWNSCTDIHSGINKTIKILKALSI